jgi:hypothetical protein
MQNPSRLVLLAELFDNTALTLASQATVPWVNLKPLLDLVAMPQHTDAAVLPSGGGFDLALQPRLVLVRIALFTQFPYPHG